MKVQISLDDINEMIYENNYLLPKTSKEAIREQVHELNGGFGKAKMTNIQFEGVYINYGNIYLKEFTVLSIKADFPVLEMHFSLSGRSLSYSNESPDKVCYCGKQHNIMYAPAFNGKMEISTRAPMQLFEIGLTISFFERLASHNSDISARMLEHVYKERPTLLNENHMPITPQMSMVISEIMYCKRAGYFKRLFMEAKVIELFLLQVEQYEQLNHPQKNIVKPTDLEKLHEAKYLVESKLDQPFSLLELSREVGLNDFKLKKGFKELFGNTIFGYLSDLKMERARNILQNHDMTIAEVSNLSGYKNQTHFTSAFKRKYGITPSELRKGC